MTDKYPMLKKFGIAELVFEDGFDKYGDIIDAEKIEEKLQSLYDSWPTVYGYGYGNPVDSEWSTRKDNWKDRVNYNVASRVHNGITHTAKLACIEEIKRECVHEPISILDMTMSSSRLSPGKIGFNYFNKDSWECLKCGIKLKAVWSAE